MRIRVLFFGMLKDVTGMSEDQVEAADGATLAAIFEHYAGRFPRVREMAGSIVLARNQEFAGQRGIRRIPGGDLGKRTSVRAHAAADPPREDHPPAADGG